MTNFGIVGISPHNGHPYSFSSIINGYKSETIKEAGWEVIQTYLDERDPSEIGLPGGRITHVWTQDKQHTKWLQEGCRIPNAVSEIRDFIGEVDAVIIARDDYERHAEMALPLLEAGLPVFLDKPLSIDPADLREFRPFLDSGQLMSCSGLRYARELDGPRARIEEYGTLKLVRGTVLNDWEKYGIHVLEPILHLHSSFPVSIRAHGGNHDSFSILMDDGSIVQIDAMGNIPPTIQVDIWGSDYQSTHNLRDNFSAFRRTLWRFLEMVKTGISPIPSEETIHIMKTLIAGKISKRRKDSVLIKNIKI